MSGVAASQLVVTMDERTWSTGQGNFKYNGRFIEFIESFAQVGTNGNLFPKECHACGRKYRNLPEFLHTTTPVRHALEDCTEAMHRPYTMQYQNCACGTTLILAFTEETYPELERLWQTLRQEAEATGRPLHEVVSDFHFQCYHFLVVAPREAKLAASLNAAIPESAGKEKRASTGKQPPDLISTISAFLSRLYARWRFPK